MRQVLLGSATANSSAAAGYISFKAKANGVDATVVASGASTGQINASAVKFGEIEVTRANADGGNIRIPFSKGNFKFVKSEAVAGVAFTASLALGSVTITPGYEYSCFFIKKGVDFNKRSKWYFSFYATANSTVADLVAAMKAFVENNAPSLGLSVSVASTTLTFTASNTRDEYEIKCVDALSGVSASSVSHTFPRNDYEDIKVILSKAAADAGFEYTEKADSALLYPMLDQNPFAVSSFTDYGFTVYTLSFVEHREVATHDTGIKQIVQIVLPKQNASTEAAQSSSLNTLLTALAA